MNIINFSDFQVNESQKEEIIKSITGTIGMSRKDNSGNSYGFYFVKLLLANGEEHTLKFNVGVVRGGDFGKWAFSQIKNIILQRVDNKYKTSLLKTQYMLDDLECNIYSTKSKLRSEMRGLGISSGGESEFDTMVDDLK